MKRNSHLLELKDKMYCEKSKLSNTFTFFCFSIVLSVWNQKTICSIGSESPLVGSHW